MQDNEDKQTTVLDEDAFYKAMQQIATLAKQAFQIAAQQKDAIAASDERHRIEVSALRSRLDEKSAELESIRKKLIDAQGKLAEFHRNENALKLEVKQYQSQLGIYRVDAKKITDLEDALRVAGSENLALRTQIETMNSEAAKLERDRKAQFDSLSLKYEQEKVLLNENIRIAEERAQSASETAERMKSLASIAEQEKNSALEAANRAKQDQKMQIEKIRGELLRKEALASEHERRVSDLQRSYERKISLSESQARQECQAQTELLKNTIEEQSHEINRLRYQLEQQKEDQRRAVEAIKQDMDKQIELRAEQIRRQFILNTARDVPTTSQ